MKVDRRLQILLIFGLDGQNALAEQVIAKTFLEFKKAATTQTLPPEDVPPAPEAAEKLELPEPSAAPVPVPVAPAIPKQAKPRRQLKPPVAESKSLRVVPQTSQAAPASVPPIQPGPSQALPGKESVPTPSTTSEKVVTYRALLEDVGFSPEFTYKGEIVRVDRGGLKAGNAYRHNFDLKLGFDFEKLAGWTGGEMMIHYLINHGQHASEYAGDLQGVSNIEAPASVSKLYEVWLQQSLAEGKVSVLLGLHDLNSEFYATESSAVFLNSSFGIGKELSQTGVNGPSVFPTTAPAARIKASPTPSSYFQMAAFNAQAGDLSDASKTHVRIDGRDGLLLINEFGAVGTDENTTQKYALGFWAYTRTFELQDPDNVEEKDAATAAISKGYYLLLDQSITDWNSLFIRYGVASGSVNSIESNLSGGAVFQGIIPRRDDDQIGFGVSSIRSGDEFMRSQTQAGSKPDRSEVVVEWLYRCVFWSGTSLQLDYQYVQNPGMNSEVDDARVGTMRLEVSL